MYQYTEFDRQFIRARAAQHRDQLERNQAGTLSDEEFRPLRLQNGWYIQRYAPMLRVAVPYGELSSAQPLGGVPVHTSKPASASSRFGPRGNESKFSANKRLETA